MSEKAVEKCKYCGKEVLFIQKGSKARVAGYKAYCLVCEKKLKFGETEGYACEKCGSPNCQGDLCR